MNSDNLGFSGGREKHAETPPINGFDFLGLDVGNDENRDFSRRTIRTAAYACHNHSEVNDKTKNFNNLIAYVLWVLFPSYIY